MNGEGPFSGVVVGTVAFERRSKPSIAHRITSYNVCYTKLLRVLSEVLEIDFDKINIIQGDTEQVKFGGGTGGSRSSQMGSIAVKRACEAVMEDAHDVAAELP